MEDLIFLFVLISIVLIVWIVNHYYENKVNEIKNKLLFRFNDFHEIINKSFEIQTDGKKIQIWDVQHKIDYIINANKEEIIKGLRLYNDYIVWWLDNSEIVRDYINKEINYSADKLLILSHMFRKRCQEEINKIFNSYDPNTLKFTLITFTVQSNSKHYNPYTKEWWYSNSPKKVTFRKEISPSELLTRVEILAQYNFEMTEYQYNCENQRKLMTPELRKMVINRDKSICQICKKLCSPNEIEIDHIKPVSKGGKTALSNLQVLCFQCNRHKSNKWLTEIINKDYNTIKSSNNSGIEYKESENFKKKYNKVKFNNLKSFDQCVQIGDKVCIKFIKTNKEVTFTLVGENDKTDISSVSINSPIGKAVEGLSIGDIVSVSIPAGVEKIQLLKLDKKI